MDAIVVGIDVSKDRLDVAVRPTGESFVFKRTGVGIEDLIVRLEALSPKMVAIEATGGFEAVVATGLAGRSAFMCRSSSPGRRNLFLLRAGPRAC